MTDRHSATTDATSSPKTTTDSAHGKLLSVIDANGNTYTSEQSKTKTVVASRAMVGAGVIPALHISDPVKSAGPKPQGFFGAIENGVSNFINTASKDEQAVAQKVESSSAFQAVAKKTESAVETAKKAIAPIAAKIEGSSIYKAAAKETHSIADGTEKLATNITIAARPYAKGLIQGGEVGAVVGGMATIPEKDSKIADFVSTTGAVTKDLAIGAFNEATHHPLQMIGAFAEGAGITLLAGGAIAAAAALAPEAAVVTTAALGVGAAIGLGYEGYQFAKHLGGWSQDAKTISNPADFSSDIVAAAHADLQGVGAEAAVIASGVAGAFTTAPLATMAASDAFDSLGANGAAASTGGDVSPTVLDVMRNAVATGRYAPQTINGVTVLMPR